MWLLSPLTVPLKLVTPEKTDESGKVVIPFIVVALTVPMVALSVILILFPVGIVIVVLCAPCN